MARATFERVTKRFDGTVALADFSLEVADGELIAVVGPSGCGKSTLLRLTAGLEPISSGTIALDGQRIDDRPPQDRDVAMVFQSYAIYPHLSVRQNIEFPLRMRGVERAARRKQAEDVAALLELGPFLDRRPAALSGGQRQRVALARALVRRPKLFLLDEPLSNLDARLRASVRAYLREMQRRLGVTMLHVTHDQTEAMTLGHRVVLLDRGRLQQVDTPLAVYERPANTFVAGFVGEPPMNLLPARHAGGVVHVGGQTIPLPAAARRTLPSDTDAIVVGVRPEAFAADVPADGALAARVHPATCERLGSETIVTARAGDAAVTVRLPGLPEPLPERVAAPAATLHLFDAGPAGTRLGP